MKRKKLKVRVRTKVRKKRTRAIAVAAAGISLAAATSLGLFAAKNKISDFLGSKRFEIKEISVTGVETLDGKTLEKHLGALKQGVSLWLANFDGIFEAVKEKYPRIKKIRFRRKLPNKIKVIISERRPVAVIRDETGVAAIDSDMTRFAAAAGENETLPLINCVPREKIRGILDFLRTLDKNDPAFKKKIREITADTVSLRLRLDDDTLILWGDTGDAKDCLKKIRALGTVGEDAKKRFGKCVYIDLTSISYGGRIVVLPAGKKI